MREIRSIGTNISYVVVLNSMQKGTSNRSTWIITADALEKLTASASAIDFCSEEYIYSNFLNSVLYQSIRAKRRLSLKGFLLIFYGGYLRIWWWPVGKGKAKNSWAKFATPAASAALLTADYCTLYTCIASITWYVVRTGTIFIGRLPVRLTLLKIIMLPFSISIFL